MAGIFSGRRAGIAGLGLSLLVAGGCAMLDSRPPEEIVKARAQLRWDALLKGDLDGAYGYLSPGSRAVNSADAYKSSIRAGFWKAAAVEKVLCSGESCEVQTQIEYVVRGSRVKTPLAETWIRQQGNWWYVLK